MAGVRRGYGTGLGRPQVSLEFFLKAGLEARGVAGVLAGDSDCGDAAPPPVQVAVGVIRSPVRSGVVWPVDLDDSSAPVADHDEVRGSHGRVAELGAWQREHSERVSDGEV